MVGVHSAGIAGGADVDENVLATLLIEMDGVSRCPHVNAVAATNHLEAIDAAQRPDHFDDLMHAPLPGADDRRHIFALCVRSAVAAPDVDVERLMQCTDERSPAEIVGLCNEAALTAIGGSLLYGWSRGGGGGGGGGGGDVGRFVLAMQLAGMYGAASAHGVRVLATPNRLDVVDEARSPSRFGSAASLRRQALHNLAESTF